MARDVEQRLALIQETVRNMNEAVAISIKRIEEIILEITEELRVNVAKKEASGFEPSFLLNFPDHLRVTVRALMKLGIATAEEVSKETSRSRSLESTYLNHLTTMGYVEKERKGQRVYYKVRFEKTAKVWE